MATSHEDISEWYDQGKTKGATHMVVMCDTFDWDDYPVFIMPMDDLNEKIAKPGEMQRIMEVYSYADKYTKEDQMAEYCAWHLD